MDSDGRISKRDADEVAILFKEHAAELYGHAKWRCNGGEALAEDLVQETFKAAALAWATTLRGRTPDGRKRWLHTTLRNKAVSAFRRSEAESRMLARFFTRGQPAEADTEAQALSAAELERVERTVSRLPHRQHQIAQMRWFDGMEGPEIAAELGIAENTVYTHLNAARKKLREELGPNYPDSGENNGEE